MKFGFADFVWVDYCIIGLIGLSALIGLMRGLIREVFSLGLWLLAVWAGLHYSDKLAVYLEHAIPLPTARMVVSFLAIFIGILFIGGILASLLANLASSSGLGGSDRLAGLLFGVARGMLFTAVMVLLAGMTALPVEPWWKQSKLIPPFQSLALWLRNQVPANLAAQIKFPEAIVKR